MLVDNLGQAVRTQLVDGLLADLLQAVRFLRVYSVEHACETEKSRGEVCRHILMFRPR